MVNNDGCALLIGVDDYSAYDRSGARDLKGSCNDVRTFYRLCRALGMKPANIRVLTSPRLDVGELEGADPENIGQATEADILSGLNWLAERIGQRSRPAGLLTFSGRGDFSQAGYVLCPSDVTGDGERGLAHALAVDTLNGIVAGTNLTVVLDACHASGQVGEALSLTGRALPADPPAWGLDACVLAATRPDGVAHQSVFDGRHHGVFSWAIACGIERWLAAQEAGGARFDVSNRELIETATGLISALKLGQTPELRAPEALAGQAFLGAQVKLRQVDSGEAVWRKVIIVFDQSDDWGNIYVFNQALGSYLTGTEYWFINRATLGHIGESDMSIVTTDQSSTTPPAGPGYASEQTFHWSENLSWGSSFTTDPLAGSGHLYAGPNGIWLRVHLAGTSPNAVTYITWYQVIASGGTPANITPQGTFSVWTGGSVAIRSGCVGYRITQQVPR